MITQYQAHLKRDPKFLDYLDRIAKYYFDGATIKQVNPMQAMMNKMMSGQMPKPPGF